VGKNELHLIMVDIFLFYIRGKLIPSYFFCTMSIPSIIIQLIKNTIFTFNKKQILFS
jgi:hypothetical protein